MSNKKTSLPLWKKYEVNRRNDSPVSMLAKELEISRTSLIPILKNKEKIIEDFEALRQVAAAKRNGSVSIISKRWIAFNEMVSSSKRRKNSSQ